jgi:hypothetical protein
VDIADFFGALRQAAQSRLGRYRLWQQERQGRWLWFGGNLVKKIV